MESELEWWFCVPMCSGLQLLKLHALYHCGNRAVASVEERHKRRASTGTQMSTPGAASLPRTSYDNASYFCYLFDKRLASVSETQNCWQKARNYTDRLSQERVEQLQLRRNAEGHEDCVISFSNSKDSLC